MEYIHRASGTPVSSDSPLPEAIYEKAGEKPPRKAAPRRRAAKAKE